MRFLKIWMVTAVLAIISISVWVGGIVDWTVHTYVFIAAYMVAWVVTLSRHDLRNLHLIPIATVKENRLAAVLITSSVLIIFAASFIQLPRYDQDHTIMVEFSLTMVRNNLLPILFITLAITEFIRLKATGDFYLNERLGVLYIALTTLIRASAAPVTLLAALNILITLIALNAAFINDKISEDPMLTMTLLMTTIIMLVVSSGTYRIYFSLTKATQ